MTTRRLFIEETTPGATGCGVREVWEPSDAELAELGYMRVNLGALKPIDIAHTFLYAFADRIAKEGVPSDACFGDAVALLDCLAGRTERANGHGVVKPCLVHVNAPSTLCGSCNAWAERDATNGHDPDANDDPDEDARAVAT